MAGEHPNLADLKEDNHRLRQVIAEARQHLDGAAASLQEVLDDELFMAETPMEVQAAMESAANAIAAATRGLHEPTAERSTSPIPGSPTRKQGQFLAYIREYMLRKSGDSIHSSWHARGVLVGV